MSPQVAVAQFPKVVSIRECRRQQLRREFTAHNVCPVVLSAPDEEFLGVVEQLSTHKAELLLDDWLAPETEAPSVLTNRCRLFSCQPLLRIVKSTRLPNGSCRVTCELDRPLSYEAIAAMQR